jgi:GxxExxY protein
MAETEIIEKELSYAIMQAAFEVHNTLGPGFPESIYDEAMARELTAQRIKIERQKKIILNYKDNPIGEFILDNIVDQRVILEYKAVTEIARVHEQQALSYLKATGLKLAIVINFGAERVQSSRVVNTKGKAVLPPHPPRLRLPDTK